MIPSVVIPSERPLDASLRSWLMMPPGLLTLEPLVVFGAAGAGIISIVLITEKRLDVVEFRQ